MARFTLHIDKIGACEICDHCFEKRHPWYYCCLGNDNFGEISYPEDCVDFEPTKDEDDENY